MLNPIQLVLYRIQHYLGVCERKIPQFYFEKEIHKILRKIEHNYNKAKYFNEACPVLKKCFEYQKIFLKEYNV